MASPTSDGEEDEEVQWGARVQEKPTNHVVLGFWSSYSFFLFYHVLPWSFLEDNWFQVHIFKNDATAASGVFCKATAAVEAHVPLESAGTVKLRTVKGWTDVSMFLWFNHYQEFGKPPGGQQCWEMCYKWFTNNSQSWMRHIWKTWKVERFKVRVGWHPPLLVAKSSPMWAPPVTCANGQLWKVVLLLYHRPRKWPCPRKCWESPRWSNKEHWIEVANYPKWNETNVGGTHFPLPWCGRKSTACKFN